jgi:hypothetical protein
MVPSASHTVRWLVQVSAAGAAELDRAGQATAEQYVPDDPARG